VLVLDSGLYLLLLRVILLNYLAFVLTGICLRLIGTSLVTLVSSFLGVLDLVFHHDITSVFIVVLLLFAVVVLGLISLRYLLLLNESGNRLALVLPITSLLVDDRHSLEISDVRAFYYKHRASNLNYVPNFERMKTALFTFGTQSKPCTVGRSDICKFEYLGCLVVSYLGVEVTHLRVLLDTE
jgi:hypothetical protein